MSYLKKNKIRQTLRKCFPPLLSTKLPLTLLSLVLCDFSKNINFYAAVFRDEKRFALQHRYSPEHYQKGLPKKTKQFHHHSCQQTRNLHTQSWSRLKMLVPIKSDFLSKNIGFPFSRHKYLKTVPKDINTLQHFSFRFYKTNYIN